MSGSPSISRMTMAYGAAVLPCLAVAALAVWAALGWAAAPRAEAARLDATDVLLLELRADLYRQAKAVGDRAIFGAPAAAAEFAEAATAIQRHLDLLPATQEDPDLSLRALGEAFHQVRTVLQVGMQRPPSPDELRSVLGPASPGDPFAAYEARLATSRAAIASARADALLRAANRGLAVLIAGGGSLLAAALTLAAARLHLLAALRRPLASLAAAADATTAGSGELEIPPRGLRELEPLYRAIDHMMRALAQSREARLRGETQAALGALVPVVAHNIRNPLASIRAVAQVNDAPPCPPETSAGLKAIIGAVDRLESWLSSLLSYLNPRQLRFSLVRPADVAAAAATLVEPQARQRGVAIVADELDQTALVWGDANLLEQAAFALLANAVEASPQGGTVRVTAAQGSGESSIAILDEGPGMPFGDMSGAATYIAPGPTTKAMGTGLGVPFARRVCDLHGGRLTFDRRPGGGTRAAIVIPHAAPDAWPAPAAASEQV